VDPAVHGCPDGEVTGQGGVASGELSGAARLGGLGCVGAVDDDGGEFADLLGAGGEVSAPRLVAVGAGGGFGQPRKRRCAVGCAGGGRCDGQCVAVAFDRFAQPAVRVGQFAQFGGGVAQVMLLFAYRWWAPLLLAAWRRRIVLGSALYLSAISLLAFALGALLRHSAAALASVFGLLLVLPIVFTLVPGPFTQKVSPFLPAAAGGQLMAPQATIDAMSKAATGTFLGPWQGFAILIAWVVVILAAAVVLLRRRNA